MADTEETQEVNGYGASFNFLPFDCRSRSRFNQNSLCKVYPKTIYIHPHQTKSQLGICLLGMNCHKLE